ncbi:energy-coupling factor ABC transporter permease [Pseudoalteromonas sp. MT33b]|uniref:energy-coupling factor ABC transporter permease n=1 Tax=Pseudoalteromonas TaxID=53246 RepID=UPI0015FB6A60|nr:energy-coupling factor ABC transporter permease [Pseudoalteromonas sp. MT33b]QMW15766.1 energy-coupling factor ABC transporter permease [Pseudoalteromonas sp. MT33b]
MIEQLQWQLPLWSCVAFILWLSFDKNSFAQLLATPIRQIGVLACALVFAVLWRIKAGILPGLELHILGVSAVTLILGWRLAIFASVLASALLILVAQLPISLLPIHLLFTAFIPISLSYLCFVLCYTYLPKHFFIYIFFCAFLTAALIACIKILTSGMLYYVMGEYSLIEISQNYLILCAIIWFPEAMLNGMAITLLITYRPHWVKTFYDKDYLDS